MGLAGSPLESSFRLPALVLAHACPMKMFLRGEWTDRPQRVEVRNPYDGSVIDRVPRASADDARAAIAGAVEGAAIMRRMPGYERSQILRRTAQLIQERTADLGRTISLEEGKMLAEGQFEATRACETIDLSADEAKRLGGEVLPLDGAPGGAEKFGFTLRVPCGVVAAITPFNFPLNLVCHKVGPALAAGNAVIIKPASDTPLSALKLVEILLEAGLPPLAIACLTGPGGELGEVLCTDPRVRKITFTGSRDVGEQICRMAGIKRVTMELGSNCPLIVMPDADLAAVAEATVATGYGNAGQVCISTQRVIALEGVYDELVDELAPQVAAITTGDQLNPATKMGPMIRERDAVRVEPVDRRSGAARCSSRDRRRAARGHARADAGGRRRSADADQLRRAVRPGRGCDPCGEHRRRDRSGQRHTLRPIRRHLHAQTSTGR